MSLPKSSTAVTWQHADTRLMSWSTRITSAPVCSGIAADDAPEVLGLLVGQAGGGLVEQDEPRLADDRARDLDEAALAGAERADHQLIVLHEAVVPSIGFAEIDLPFVRIAYGSAIQSPKLRRWTTRTFANGQA